MYPEVETLLLEVLALDERFRPLCRDARAYAIERGEAEGILFARMLLKCARQRVAESLVTYDGWGMERFRFPIG